MLSSLRGLLPHRTLFEALGLAAMAALALVFLYTANLELTALNTKVEQVEDLCCLLLVKKAVELAAKGYEVVVFIPKALDHSVLIQGDSLAVHGCSAPLPLKAMPCFLEPGGCYKVFCLNGLLKVVPLR